MKRVPVPQLLQELSQFFIQKGYCVYLVGGAVRDLFLNKKAEDWDIATDATPEQVSQIFKRIIPTGIEHGTVTIVFRDKMIECTTFRTEQGYTDGRRPDRVAYSVSIEEDLSRRDFTMNAIAVSLPDGKVFDPFNGRSDIKAGLIKTVGEASERFAEDGLRPLRAVRFASQLGFTIDEKTLSAISPVLHVTARVAKERIRDEFVKILVAPAPSTGLLFMEKTGLLQLVLPELQSCRGIEQKGQHRYDVLDHLLHACDLCQTAILELRIAALFHDIGKPLVRAVNNDGVFTFYNHEVVSAEIAEKILERLRFSQKTIKSVTHLIRQHMFNYDSAWTDAAVRRFIVRVGEESIDLLFALRFADSFAITGNHPYESILTEFRSRINALISAEHAFSLKDLRINGTDLRSMGIKEGPQTGIILNEILESVIDDPTLNTKETLTEIAQEIYQRKFLHSIEVISKD